MRARLFRNGRSQAVEVHRDPDSGAVVLTPVRPSAKELLELRDTLLQEPGFREELDAFSRGCTTPALPNRWTFPDACGRI
jgi:antitoxin VapB